MNGNTSSCFRTTVGVCHGFGLSTTSYIVYLERIKGIQEDRVNARGRMIANILGRWWQKLDNELVSLLKHVDEVLTVLWHGDQCQGDLFHDQHSQSSLNLMSEEGRKVKTFNAPALSYRTKYHNLRFCRGSPRNHPERQNVYLDSKFHLLRFCFPNLPLHLRHLEINPCNENGKLQNVFRHLILDCTKQLTIEEVCGNTQYAKRPRLDLHKVVKRRKRRWIEHVTYFSRHYKDNLRRNCVSYQQTRTTEEEMGRGHQRADVDLPFFHLPPSTLRSLAYEAYFRHNDFLPSTVAREKFRSSLAFIPNGSRRNGYICMREQNERTLNAP